MYNFLRSIQGYLTVEIKGDCSERLINKAAFGGLHFWNLKYRKKCITGNISIDDFKELREIKRGLGVDITIVQKHGLPFKIHRYRYRYGMFMGVFIFFSILFLLSQFVWTVDVKGNINVTEKEIISLCKELNIKEGMYKNNLNSAVDAQKLLLKSKNLSWAALNLEGCVLTVSITEMRNDIPLNANEPCSLKSTADGTILKIDVTAGNVEVKVGDTVRKGDILVSGIEETVEDGTLFVHSDGTVIAKTRRLLTAEGDFCEEIRFLNGKVKKHKVLSFFWLDIPLYLGKIKGEYDYKIKETPLKIFDKKIPIVFIEKECYMTETKQVNYSEEELKEKLRRKIKNQIKELKIDEYEIYEEKLEYTEKGIRVVWQIDSVENIAEKEKILLVKN